MNERTRMRSFVEDSFRSLHRVEQRRWAQAYLWALIHASGKKTPRRLAQAEWLPSAAANGLQQFINSSPWDWQPVRHRLAHLVSADTTPYAWTVAKLVIPKSGNHSVGVHRRVDTATGRVTNCQRAMGLFLATDTGCFPVSWNLILAGPWDWDRQLRHRARIPDAEQTCPIDAYGLDFAPKAPAELHLPQVPWVLNLTRCDYATGVLARLARRRVDMVCEVDANQVVLTGRRAPTVSHVGALMETQHAANPHAAGRQSATGHAKVVPIQSYLGTVRLPQLNTGSADDSPTYRILKWSAPDGRRPSRYWITNLSDQSAAEVLRLVRSRSAALTTLSIMQERFGVLDFEGRSFPGWHHHMTMASAAYVYQYLHGDPGIIPAPPTASPAELAGVAN